MKKERRCCQHHNLPLTFWPHHHTVMMVMSIFSSTKMEKAMLLSELQGWVEGMVALHMGMTALSLPPSDALIIGALHDDDRFDNGMDLRY